MERRNIEVPRAHGGEAVARILHDGLGVAHSVAKGLIDEGCVTINGRPARTHGQRCETGDVVEVRFDPARRYQPAPVPRHGPGFRIVQEDREMVVVNKMPGVLSSPAPGGDESLAERIAASLRERGIRKPQLFVVHRLDRHTSGLLVFAKSQRALESLTAQFESRQAGRIYTAIVEGRVQKEAGTIISHLLEDPKTLSVRTTHLRGAGKRAVTHFEVVERLPEATILKCRLETGRKHQIRVHLAEIGHPVIGDRRYGRGSSLIARVALHAERLSFQHPSRLEKVTHDAPWPDDLLRLAHTLRKGGSTEEHRRDAESGRAPAPGRAGGAGAQRNIGLDAAGDASARDVPRERDDDGARMIVFPKGLVLLDPIARVETPSTERKPQAATGHHPDVRQASARGAPVVRQGGREGARFGRYEDPRRKGYADESGGAPRGGVSQGPRDHERRGPAAADRGGARDHDGNGRRPFQGSDDPARDRARRARLAAQRSVTGGDLADQARRARRSWGGQASAPPTVDEEHPAPRRHDRDRTGGWDRARDRSRASAERPASGGEGRDQARGFDRARDRNRAPAERPASGGQGRDQARGFDRARDRDRPLAERPASGGQGRDQARGFDRARDRDRPLAERPASGGQSRDQARGFDRARDRDRSPRPVHGKGPGPGPGSQRRPPVAGKARPAAVTAPSVPGGKDVGKRGPSTGPGATRKPWEFKQKGMTLKRERRRKIAHAQAKARKKHEPKG